MLSPELGKLFIRVTVTKISQGNQLGAAHPAGSGSIGSPHRESCGDVPRAKGARLTTPRSLQQVCKGNVVSQLPLTPIYSNPFLPTLPPLHVQCLAMQSLGFASNLYFLAIASSPSFFSLLAKFTPFLAMRLLVVPMVYIVLPPLS